MSDFNGQELFLSFKTQGQPLIFLSLFTEELVYCSLRGGYGMTYTGAGWMFAVSKCLRDQARCLV